MVHDLYTHGHRFITKCIESRLWGLQGIMSWRKHPLNSRPLQLLLQRAHVPCPRLWLKLGQSHRPPPQPSSPALPQIKLGGRLQGLVSGYWIPKSFALHASHRVGGHQNKGRASFSSPSLSGGSGICTPRATKTKTDKQVNGKEP